MEIGTWLVLRGALSICKFLGYQNCAKMAAMSFGKRAVKKAAIAGLSSTGVIPVSLVSAAGSAIGYAPTVVVFASGVLTNGLTTTVSFIVLSQVTDYVFVVAIRTAVASGVHAAFNVVRYVLFSRPPPQNLIKLRQMKKLDNKKAFNELEDGWVVIEDEQQVPEVIREYENVENVDLEAVKKQLEEVETVATQLDPEKVEYIELRQQNEGEELDEDFVVVPTSIS